MLASVRNNTTAVGPFLQQGTQAIQGALAARESSTPREATRKLHGTNPTTSSRNHNNHGNSLEKQSTEEQPRPRPTNGTAVGHQPTTTTTKPSTHSSNIRRTRPREEAHGDTQQQQPLQMDPGGPDTRLSTTPTRTPGTKMRRTTRRRPCRRATPKN